MGYESFKKTERFKVLSEAMKLQAYLFFHDPDGKGLTFSELKLSKLDHEIINQALDMWEDNQEVERLQAERNRFFVAVYRLTAVGRSGIKGWIYPPGTQSA
jgi:hypothetical protein